MQQADVGASIRVALGGLSISDAARQLKVGRSGLSNLIAGKARLSRAMAVKIGREFPLDVEQVMRDQGDVDADAARRLQKAETKNGADAAWRRNAADYHDITAADIAQWANNTERARGVLPVLIRRLVYAVAPNSRLVDFPGHDAGQRPGWDGRVDTLHGGPWVPEGLSGWELSTSADLPGKPTSDIKERRRGSVAERRLTTFVFVTARNWPGKKAWEEKQQRVGDWRGVRAFDASDLAQWLDQSAPTQAWFARELNRSVDGVRPMSEVWDAWSNATKPLLSAKLFSPALEAHRARLHDWLVEPNGRPFIVVATSVDEATAFAAEALKEADGSHGAAFSGASVVSSPNALRRLAAAAPGAVIVVDTLDTETAAAGLHHSHRIVVASAHPAVGQEPDITLEPLADDAFDAALADMAVPEAEWGRWRAEAGNSPTILRRRLALLPALRRPAWSQDADLLRKLMPVFLAGAWHRDAAGDMGCVELLAGKKIQDVERDITELAALADPPVWAIDRHRGIVSRKDTLFAIAGAVTPEDLDTFFAWRNSSSRSMIRVLICRLTSVGVRASWVSAPRCRLCCARRLASFLCFLRCMATN